MSPDDRLSSAPERAVVDRIHDGWAVLLVGDAETEHPLRESELPNGVAEGSVLQVRLDGSEVEIVDVDDGATHDAREEMRDRLTRLKKTRSTGRFTEPR